MFIFYFFMPLFLAKHGLFFGDYAAAYATFRWLCFRLCSIFRGHIYMPQKGDYAPANATFVAYAIYYALILGSNMLSRGDCATAVLLHGRFHFTLVFVGDIVFFIYLLLRNHQCCVIKHIHPCMHDACKVYVCAHAFIHRKMFRDYCTRYRIKIGLCFG